MQQAVAEIVLGDEGCADRAAEDDDVEPAEVVGEEQAVRAWRNAVEGCAYADNPGRCCQEALRPT